MLIKCLRDDLLAKLQIVQKGTANQTTLPILSGVLLKTSEDILTLQATNLEISILATVKATIKKPGMSVFPARLLVDIVRSLPPGQLEIGHDETDDNTVFVKAENTKFKIKTQAPEDFPNFPKVEKETELILDADKLSYVLKQTLKAVSKDETRPILNGILFSINKDKITLVSTDSYRLALSEIRLKSKIKEEQEIVIPWRALDELQKIISSDAKEIKLVLGKNQAIFQYSDITFVSRLLEGQFPNYKQLLPSEFGITAEIRRQDLVGAVTRASLIAQKNQSVKLSVKNKKLTISAQSANVGETTEDLAIKLLSGEEIEIAFNSQYLLDGATSSNKETVVLELNNSVSPGLIRSPKNNESIYLIMPIRVS